MRAPIALLALVAFAAVAGCRSAVNYPDRLGPRFAGPLPGAEPDRNWPDTPVVVTFNGQEGRAVDSALAVIESEGRLARPDVVLLEEMDEPGTRRLAEALGMGWVDYPAAVRSGTGRDFGTAVLSRWPIVDDEKLLRPNVGTFGRIRRTATAATLDNGGVPLGVYSLHLATPVDLGIADRTEQRRTVLRGASTHPRAIIGRDFNSASLPEVAEDRGFHWPTRNGPKTTLFGRFDHTIYRGLGPPPVEVQGTVLDRRDASDHRLVWAHALMR